MSGKESTYIDDIANSKLLLYYADFTESSYDYIPSAQRCPAEREEIIENHEREPADKQTASLHGCARIDAQHRKGCSPLYGAARRIRMTVWTGIQAPQDALRGSSRYPV